MADDQSLRTVKISQWPEQALQLSHSFDAAKPCAVSISTTAQQPLEVEMAMQLSAREPVPFCISICEPICAQSDYTISVDIFDRPVAAVTVRGLTRLFNCGDKAPLTK